jgi:phage baseplate assembly protein W
MIEESMILGVGWSFPPSFDKYSKSIEMVHDEIDIHQSLQVLFATTPGERTMELEYGCDLSPLAFQRLDLNLKTFMINNIKDAIARCEPRISVNEIRLEMEDDISGTVNIHVSYIVKSSNMPGNLVYVHSFE